jgi:hypothetical protein
MERKTLTLNEVLNLNRKPTLQEMVDLSVEDYVKYLYHRGVIKYIPENYDLWEYEFIDNDDYQTQMDIVHKLRSPYYGEEDPDDEFGDWDKPEGFTLNESEEWDNPNIIEKGILYVNGKEVEYDITINNGRNLISIYEKYSNGKYSLPDCREAYYLS